MDLDAIRGAVKGVLEGSLGAVRTLPGNTLLETKAEDFNVDQLAVEARTNPRFELYITDLGDHPDSPSKTCDTQLARLEVHVRTHHLLKHYGRNAAARGLPKSVATEHGRLILEALTWPGNLGVDGSANPTGIIGGLLDHVSTSRPNVLGESKLTTTNHFFEGVVLISAPIA